MMTITLMALARRLQNYFCLVSTEVLVLQVQTNKVKQIHIHRFFLTKCPINRYNTLNGLTFTLSGALSLRIQKRPGCGKWIVRIDWLVNRFFRVRIDASCVIPHFAPFFFLWQVVLYQPGVRKLWSAGHIWPTGCFCTVMNSGWFLHL